MTNQGNDLTQIKIKLYSEPPETWIKEIGPDKGFSAEPSHKMLSFGIISNARPHWVAFLTLFMLKHKHLSTYFPEYFLNSQDNNYTQASENKSLSLGLLLLPIVPPEFN